MLIGIAYVLLMGIAYLLYCRVRYYSGPLVDTIKKQTEPPNMALEVTFKSLDAKIEVRSNVGFEVLYVLLFVC